MPRDIPVGNGNLLVAFNRLYEICDLYFPHVGMENHVSGNAFRFGVWIDGEHSWVRSDGWKRELDYRENTLVTKVKLRNDSLGIEMQCSDCVDFHEDVFVRKIVVRNRSSLPRKARIFLHHDFNISDNDVGDTAYFDPRTNSIIHYKKHFYFLISSCTEFLCGGFQYATGLKRTPRHEGTWRDAEDGVLSGNPITQGAVDSVLGMQCDLEREAEATLFYWIAAGTTYHQVRMLNSIIHDRTPQALIERTHNYWKLWATKECIDLSSLPPSIGRLYTRSLLILRTHIDNGGAIIAANDSDILQFGRDTYSYMWPRDGAFVSRALDLAGYPELSRRFYKFCNFLENEGYLLHKYNPDGSPGSSWHSWFENGDMQLPIQEDETALVIWALWNHFTIYRDVELIKPLYKPLIKSAGDFMLGYREQRTGLPFPSYDLWEEKRGISTFTTAAVIAGLRAAANFAKAFGENDKSSSYMEGAAQMRAAMMEHLYSREAGRFVKMIVPTQGNLLKDETIDASLFGAFYFGAFEPLDACVQGTMDAIRRELTVKTAVGGIARYRGDTYQRASNDAAVPGNPWVLCTLWLAQYQIAIAKSVNALREPLELFEWVAAHACQSGVLAEQIHPHTGGPVSVSPLSWSHATFVLAVLEYLNKLQELSPEKPHLVSRLQHVFPQPE